jgi:hypothetical protein
VHVCCAALALWVGADRLSGAEAPRKCFDLGAPVTEPLRPPLPLLEGKDNTALGTYPDGLDWAAVRGTIRDPIETVYRRLLDHRNVKDMSKTKLETRVLQRPGLLEYHVVDIAVTVSVVFFKKTITWSEEWGFSLAAGTPEKPERIVASYQKLAGTSHLKHECGNYVLQRLPDGTTDIAMYEEVKATRRSARDTLNMHLGNLRKLRGEEPASAGR